jgi:hypothetical protein
MKAGVMSKPATALVPLHLVLLAVAIAGCGGSSQSSGTRLANQGGAGGLGMRGDPCQFPESRSATVCAEGCRQGIAADCGTAGDLYADLQDYEQTVWAYSRACELGEGPSCNQLGLVVEGFVFQHEATDREVVLAGRAYQHGCELRHAVSCASYADYLSVEEPMRPDIESYYELSCQLGHPRGCTNARVRRDARMLVQMVATELRMCGAGSAHARFFTEPDGGITIEVIGPPTDSPPAVCLLNMLDPLVDRFPIQPGEEFDVRVVIP